MCPSICMVKRQKFTAPRGKDRQNTPIKSDIARILAGGEVRSLMQALYVSYFWVRRSS